MTQTFSGAILQEMKGISEGAKKKTKTNNLPVCLLCKLEQTLGRRSCKYQRNTYLPHYLVSVSFKSETNANAKLSNKNNFFVIVGRRT